MNPMSYGTPCTWAIRLMGSKGAWAHGLLGSRSDGLSDLGSIWGLMDSVTFKWKSTIVVWALGPRFYMGSHGLSDLQMEKYKSKKYKSIDMAQGIILLIEKALLKTFSHHFVNKLFILPVVILMRQQFIINNDVDSTCRLCLEDEETSWHVIAECPALIQIGGKRPVYLVGLSGGTTFPV
jgi:hypothetical protein